MDDVMNNSQLATRNSQLTQHRLPKLSTQHSYEEPGELAAVGSVLLAGVLVAAIFWAMNSSTAQARFDTGQADSMLAGGRYSDAVAMYERILPVHDTPGVRLGLSYAYLARRDGARAERQALLALSS